jgi:hypothetical protein
MIYFSQAERKSVGDVPIIQGRAMPVEVPTKRKDPIKVKQGRDNKKQDTILKCCVCGSDKVYCQNSISEMCFCEECILHVKGHYGFIPSKELRDYIIEKRNKKWWQIWK